MAPLENQNNHLYCFNLNVSNENPENDPNEDSSFEEVYLGGAMEDEPEEIPASPPLHIPAGFLDDEGDDVLDAEELYAHGILTLPPSPPHYNFDADDIEDPWQPEEQVPLLEVVPEVGLAAFALQHLGEYMEFLEFLEGEENGGPGVPQALIPAPSGSLDPPPPPPR